MGLAEIYEKIPDWCRNVIMHAVAGFVIGFNGAFVITDFKAVSWDFAIKGALIIGGYSAVKEVLAYLTTLVPVNSAPATAAPVVSPTTPPVAAPVVTPKPRQSLVSRMP